MRDKIYSSHRKVLYFTAEGFNTPNPNNQLLTTLIDDMLQSGMKVGVVQSRKTDMYSDVPNVLPGRKGLNVATIPRNRGNKNHFTRRYLSELFFMFHAVLACRKEKDVDIVLLQANPVGAFYVFLLKWILHKPIVYNLFDFFPGCAKDVGIIGSPILYSCLNLASKIAYRFCECIVVPGIDMKNTLIGQGVSEGKNLRYS